MPKLKIIRKRSYLQLQEKETLNFGGQAMNFVLTRAGEEAFVKKMGSRKR